AMRRVLRARCIFFAVNTAIDVERNDSASLSGDCGSRFEPRENDFREPLFALAGARIGMRGSRARHEYRNTEAYFALAHREPVSPPQRLVAELPRARLRSNHAAITRFTKCL